MPFPAEATPAAVWLTYAEFHVLFVVPPLVLLAASSATRRADGDGISPAGVALVAAVALIYTAPWDNYLIARGVWRYGDGSVAATVWNAPVEEYLFVLLQSVVAALWLDQLSLPDGRSPSLSMPVRVRATGVLVGGTIAVAGMAAVRREPTFYLGAILLWAAPVLALQWGVGWPVLWRRRRTVAAGVLVPTAYLWVADRIALRVGVWTLSERYTTGVAVLGLPVEEAVFFLATNLFVIQGLVLFEWVVRRWR